MNLDDLDKALHDLGMLSAITEVCREHRRVRKHRSNCNMMRRYVSNVTVGYCMKRTATKNRLCPYVLPIRHRTKSENSDVVAGETGDACEFMTSISEPSTSSCSNMVEGKSPAKRCQSLENLNLSAEPPAGPEASPELDCVSNRIQKLQVDE